MTKNDLDLYLKNKTIAVLGGAIIKEKKGIEIDNHDIVIRMNLCITKGFEELRGKKTNICCTSGFSLFERYETSPPAGISFIICFFPKNKPTKNNEVLLPDCTYFDCKKALEVRKPTTGFLMLHYLYENNIKANVYGFDFYKTINYDLEYISNKIKTLFPEKYVAAEDKDILKNIFTKSVHKPIKEKAYWEEHPWHNFK